MNYNWKIFFHSGIVSLIFPESMISLDSVSSLAKYITVVDETRLTGWVKPGEIWQLNFWIWTLQAEENYVRIQYSMKIWTPLRSFYSEMFLFSCVFAHSYFGSAYHFLVFPILMLYGIAFRI